MKPALRLTLVFFAVAAGTFALTRWWLRPAPIDDEVTALARDFHLDASQAAAIRRLREAFEPVCADHCAAIRAAHRELVSLSADDPARASATAHLAKLEAICRDATTAHLHAVAAAMPPEEGARFLSLALPRVAGRQTHDGPAPLE